MTPPCAVLKPFRTTLLSCGLALAHGSSAQAGATIGLGSIFGIELPSITLPDLPGLPVSLPNLSLPKPSLPALPSVATPSSVGLSASSDKPDYSVNTQILSLADSRIEKLTDGRVPFVEVIHTKKLETYQSHRDECRAKEVKGEKTDASTCPQYEWSLPFALEGDSQQSARELRAAWQRFEDRYYWRTMTELNNPAYYLAFCAVDWGGGVNPDAPEVKVHVPNGVLEKSLRGKVPTSDRDQGFSLDDYIPLPKVHNQDFCDDLSLQILPLMYIPGFCVDLFGTRLFCSDDIGLKGDATSLGPGPSPIWWNTDEATNRVTDAIKRAHTTYLTEYQADAMKALLPGKTHPSLFVMPWRSNLPGDGVMLAPVMNLNPDFTPVIDLANTARNALGSSSLEGLNALPYYLQSALRSPSLDLELVGGNAVVGTPPGVWQLEEFKRLLPVTNLAYMERFGYVPFYEAWNQLDATILPEGTAAKALRPILYFAVGIDLNIDLSGITATPMLSPIPVAPFLLPFVGPRLYADWVSVPDGYQIPRVVGEPHFDYRPVLRTDSRK